MSWRLTGLISFPGIGGECSLANSGRGGGIKGFDRKSLMIKTPSGVMAAVLAGRPLGQGWDNKIKSLYEELSGASESMTFPKAGLTSEPPRRGDYRVMHTRLSYGGGSMVCDFILEVAGRGCRQVDSDLVNSR
jgi:hypothetical protein